MREDWRERTDQEGAPPLPEPCPGKGRRAFANLDLALRAQGRTIDRHTALRTEGV
jgi:hypothetical protein